jgi:hypothetical protein
MHRVVPVTNEESQSYTAWWFSLLVAEILTQWLRQQQEVQKLTEEYWDGLMSSVHPHLAKIGQQEFKYKREYTGCKRCEQGTPTELVRWLNVQTFWHY